MLYLKTGHEACFFINPIKKVGLTYVRIVLKFTTNLKNLSRAAEGLDL